MPFYSLVVLVHIVSGSFAVMNHLIMQVVVSGIMQRLPAGTVKKDVDDFLEKHWRPIMGYVILLLGASAIAMFYANFQMILTVPAYSIKAILGAIAIGAAAFNHFYYRHKKKEWVGREEFKVRFERSKVVSFWLEKTVLYCAIGAASIAWYMRHG